MNTIYDITFELHRNELLRDCHIATRAIRND